MIYNWKKPFGLHGLYKNIPALPPVPIILFFFIFYWHIKFQHLNMLKKQLDINKQDFKNRLHPFCQMIMILTHFYLALND